ncbi:MAG TPA: DUF1552 domain-containing protein [Terriglobia bacterium]|jgi:hypothetical protein|nr:DUF1552 domain-containing protein [Terriglobia bacterium]
MFITKRSLPRRTFLKGAGGMLALPLLEAMIPASTALAQTPATPTPRFAGIFFPHGMAPGHWEMPEGPLPEKLSTIMASLEKVKENSVILGGMWSRSAEPPEGTTGSDHWVAAAFMTANKPKKTTGSDSTVYSPTIDQVIANKIGKDSTLPSLQLAVEDPGSNSSSCGEGYACSYTNSISWVGTYDQNNEIVGTKALPMELNPQVVFERLFGSGATPEVRAARRAQGKSILDNFMQSLGGLKKNVGASDRTTLDQYTDEVREIERRLDLAAKASEVAPSMNEPSGIPQNFDDHIKMHYDLVALAFKADITRVATLLGARDLTGRSYPFPKNELFPNGGTSVSFHGGSHHADVPATIANYAQLNRYHVSTTAYFAELLKKTPDGDGTLLDHTLILHGTNMGNSNQHQHYDVPHILIGGANGKLKGGRFLNYERKTVTTGNLLLSILDMYGIHKDKQGDSTDRLAKL